MALRRRPESLVVDLDFQMCFTLNELHQSFYNTEMILLPFIAAFCVSRRRSRHSHRNLALEDDIIDGRWASGDRVRRSVRGGGHRRDDWAMSAENLERAIKQMIESTSGRPLKMRSSFDEAFQAAQSQRRRSRVTKV